MAWYVPWYNAEHKHAGIALFSPNEVHAGSWRQAWARREQTQQAYYQQHPERYRRRPTTPLPAGIVASAQERRRTAARTTPGSLTTPET